MNTSVQLQLNKALSTIGVLPTALHHSMIALGLSNSLTLTLMMLFPLLNSISVVLSSMKVKYLPLHGATGL